MSNEYKYSKNVIILHNSVTHFERYKEYILTEIKENQGLWRIANVHKGLKTYIINIFMRLDMDEDPLSKVHAEVRVDAHLMSFKERPYVLTLEKNYYVDVVRVKYVMPKFTYKVVRQIKTENGRVTIFRETTQGIEANGQARFQLSKGNYPALGDNNNNNKNNNIPDPNKKGGKKGWGKGGHKGLTHVSGVRADPKAFKLASEKYMDTSKVPEKDRVEFRELFEKLTCRSPSSGTLNNAIFEKQIASYYSESHVGVYEFVNIMKDHMWKDDNHNKIYDRYGDDIKHLGSNIGHTKFHYNKAPVQIQDKDKSYKIPKMLCKGHVRYCFILSPNSSENSKLEKFDSTDYRTKIMDADLSSYVIIFETMYDIEIESLSGEIFNSSRGKIFSFLPYFKYVSYHGIHRAQGYVNKSSGNFNSFLLTTFAYLQTGDPMMQATATLWDLLGINSGADKNVKVDDLIFLVRICLLIGKFTQKVVITNKQMAIDLKKIKFNIQYEQTWNLRNIFLLK